MFFCNLFLILMTYCANARMCRLSFYSLKRKKKQTKKVHTLIIIMKTLKIEITDDVVDKHS